MIISYDNYNHLLNDNEELALELLEERGIGEWQNEQIYYYHDKEVFAEYELTEGWYIDLNLDNHDFKGAPNPLDYIDLKEFGNALINRWDESCNYLTSTGEILTTGYGW